MGRKLNMLMVIMVMLVISGCNNETDNDEDNDEDFEIQSSYPILDSSFETDINFIPDSSWDTFVSDATINRDTNESSDGKSSLRLDSTFGGFGSVWQVLPIDDEPYSDKFDDQMSDLKSLASEKQYDMPKIGDRVELNVDVKIDEETDITDSMPFLIYVESEDESGEKTIIAETDIVELEKGTWNTLTTSPLNNDGIVPDDSVLLVISFQINLPEDGTVYLDNAEFGRTSGSAPEDDDPKTLPFENEGEALNIPDHSFEEGNPFSSEDSLDMEDEGYYGNKSLRLEQDQKAELVLDIRDQALGDRTLSAGIWAKATGVIGEGLARLHLEAYFDGQYHSVSESHLETSQAWGYLKTPVLDETYDDKNIEKVRITLESTLESPVLFDFIQFGDYQAFNGNPTKMAFIEYHNWYASEEDGWGNWKYTGASQFDGGRNSFPSRIIDGKRDIASVYYPLVGAYDSTDPELIEYHVDLMAAMNGDVIQVNYYADLDRNMSAAFDQLMETAEQKNMKATVLYEPKIHINGWIPHSNRMESIEAITQDIINLLDEHGDSKALLKYDGKPVVQLFGVNLVREKEWRVILESVNEAGHDPILMGDNIGGGDYSSMTGMFHWSLYNDDMDDYTEEEAKQHSLSINQRAIDWSDEEPGAREPVGIVYPGFDDTKVLGWDTGVARKIDITGESFYRASWDAALELEDDLDWLIVATFNDWNEGTQIEPSVENGHLLAEITQEKIAQFKGEGVIDPALLQEITQDYLDNRTTEFD